MICRTVPAGTRGTRDRRIAALLTRPQAPQGYTMGYWDTDGVHRSINSITVIPVLLNIGTPEAVQAAQLLGSINANGISYSNQDFDLLSRALGVIRTAEMEADVLATTADRQAGELFDGLA